MSQSNIINSADHAEALPAYTWQSIFAIVKQHKKPLILANIIAIFAAVVSVPVPLLMPLLVDEVLLEKPGKIVELLSSIFPSSWLTPVSIIAIVMLLSMLLRLVA
ncbi:MAG: ABC transporter ATP-binding protein, partial [Gammaproteobacteria bacterium]|nr:ABC transporter ATP-binding protein [Gammaproteobacteria bacterium]